MKRFWIGKGAVLLALLALMAWPAGAAEGPATWERPGENIALGKSYTLTPRPNYALCRDDGDRTQLTDGQYTVGYFWTQQTTVGWSGGGQTRIVIDLGQVEPIVGVSFHTAAGRADVRWPRGVLLFVSDDGETWWRAGDLVALNRSPEPPADTYATRRYWTDRLTARGRYVAVVLVPGGHYAFCDEIEVYRGDQALLTRPREGRAVVGLDAAITALRFEDDARVEAEAIRARIRESRVSATEKTRLQAMLDQAVGNLGEIEGVGGNERAIWPYGKAHEKLLAVQAALWRAEGRPALQAWAGSCWDPLLPWQAPERTAAANIDLVMMRNEVRSAAINITNANDAAQRLKVTFAGLPGSPKPEWIRVRQTVWTPAKPSSRAPEGVEQPRVAGSALPDAPDGVVTVPGGTTGQVWLSLDTSAVPAGDYRGRVELTPASGEPLTVPIRVRVSALSMPNELTLALGGWDYTDGPGRGITEENLEATVEFLRSYHVNAPWAVSAVMPFGKHDATGKMVEPPDTKRLDAWIARWPNARYYCVYNAFTKDVETPEDRRRVAEWITFYVEHLKKKGIAPSQLVLLLVDEPRNEEQDQRIVSYARVLREVAPEVIVFNDPIWKDPRDTSREMLELSGMLCPNRVSWLGSRGPYEEVYLPQRDAGRLLAFYSCSGPVRALDPYSYHRLQAWEAFRYGAIYQAFWAFGDTGGGSAWNEYSAPGTCYSPQFLDASGNTTSKHMEAIREGLYDYEYLVLLRKAVEQAEKSGRNPAAVRQARQLLTTLPAQVVDAEGAEAIEWHAPKQRDLADKARQDVLKALEALAQ